MTKYLAGVLSVIAVGILLIAYGLLAPGASASRGTIGQGSMQLAPVYATPNGDVTTAPAVVPIGYVPMNAAVTQGVVGLSGDMRAVPVTLNQPLTSQPAVYQPAVYQAPAAQPAAPRRTVTVVKRAPRRDWTKTALVIGGSSATGAGIGGIIGGGKGAAIGAAIGGGVSTLFETTRH